MSDRAGSRTSGRNRSSREIRSEIEATRARLARDIDAVQMKLSPKGLQHEAISALRGVRQESGQAISSLGGDAKQGAGQMGDMVVGAVKRFPVATTLVGIGIALLAFSSVRGRDGRQRTTEKTDLPVPRPEPRATLPPTTP